MGDRKSVYFDNETLEWLKKKEKTENRSFSNVVSTAVKEKMEKENK